MKAFKKESFPIFQGIKHLEKTICIKGATEKISREKLFRELPAKKDWEHPLYKIMVN